MTISEAMRTLRRVAEGVVEPATVIYDVTDYAVKIIDLDPELRVELHYQHGELTDGYIMRNDSRFSMSVEEIEVADMAQLNYEKLRERIRKEQSNG